MDSMLANLTLSHEEDEELVLNPESLPKHSESLDLCLVGRFLTDLPINFNLLRNRLASAWRPKKGVLICDIGSGRFLFQFYHLLDLKRVVDGGPWSFGNFLLVYHKLEEGEHPLRVSLETIPFWVQIFDLPIGYMSENIGRQLGNFIGRFLEYDVSNSVSVWRMYMRVRVAINVKDPLKRCKKIKKADGNSFMASFKYEKLGSFCFVCGRLGHTESFCDTLFISPDGNVKKEWGAWLKAQDRKSLHLGGEKWLKEEGSGSYSGLSDNSDKGPANPGVTDRRRGEASFEFQKSVTHANLASFTDGRDPRDNSSTPNSVIVENPIFEIVPMHVGGKSDLSGRNDYGNYYSALPEDRKRRRNQTGDPTVSNTDNMVLEDNPTLVDFTHAHSFLLAGPGLSGPMIVLSWNCRGLGQPHVVPALCELVRVHWPDVVFLFETLSHRVRVEDVRIKLQFHCSFSVDCIGRSGGLCVLWKSTISCSLLCFSQNHIDLEIVDGIAGSWRLTGYYGCPEHSRRHISWVTLRQLCSSSTRPWVCIGDYNDLLNICDKRERVEHPNWLFSGFRKAIEDCNLFDLPLVGHQFTWSRCKGTPNAVEERPDRAMATPSWSSIFPNAKLSNLVAPVSDHNPILLETEPILARRRHRLFRFENKWLSETDLPAIVENV